MGLNMEEETPRKMNLLCSNSSAGKVVLKLKLLSSDLLPGF